MRGWVVYVGVVFVDYVAGKLHTTLLVLPTLAYHRCGHIYFASF